MITSRYGYGTAFTTPSAGVRLPLDMSIRQDDQYVTVVSGDRVDNLANTYLGDSALWWIVCDWNAIRFPLELSVGSVLRIPSRKTLDTLL